MGKMILKVFSSGKLPILKQRLSFPIVYRALIVDLG